MLKKGIEALIRNPFYANKYRGALFVVKAGGNIVSDASALENLIGDIHQLTLNGIKVILIYGGGAMIDTALKEKGIEPQKHNGRRITTKEDMGVIKQVLPGTLGFGIYETAARLGVPALCLNAVPSDWIEADFRPKNEVDFGYVGDIHGINTRPINRVLKAVDFVAAPCIAPARTGEALNINADTIATELAVGMKAQKLVFLSDVDGVLKNGQTISFLTDADIAGLINDGTASGGMRVKLENCANALQRGVKRIHLLNGFKENVLSDEIFDPKGSGTMLIREEDRKSYNSEVTYQSRRSA